MEDVLDVYTRPYDPRRPQVCLDETSVQLIGETRTPVPMAPAQPARYDFEYAWADVRPILVRDRITGVYDIPASRTILAVHTLHQQQDQVVG
jgi:hypothetical protein